MQAARHALAVIVCLFPSPVTKALNHRAEVLSDTFFGGAELLEGRAGTQLCPDTLHPKKVTIHDYAGRCRVVVS